MASGTGLPPLPASLKAIQHYLKIGDEHEARDPVVTYYCRMYAIQRGMEIDKSSKDAKTYLLLLMDLLEKTKSNMTSDEAIQSEVVGQAHMESYALKVFLFADNEDRAGRFSKNVVKSFYTAGMLFDTLSQFGEIAEDIEKNKKYAKWKAAYIHKCLKSGETPISGPMEGEEDVGYGATAQPGTSYQPPSSPGGFQEPPPAGFQQPPPSGFHQQPTSQLPVPPAGSYAPQNTPSEPSRQAPSGATGGKQVTTEDYQQAMKFCKFASSAIQYEDKATAVDNLRKALALLDV